MLFNKWIKVENVCHDSYVMSHSLHLIAFFQSSFVSIPLSLSVMFSSNSANAGNQELLNIDDCGF